jgi:hypothetical protein
MMMEFRYGLERPVVRAKKVTNYKAREELFARALAIAETLRGDRLLANEYAALFYGIMIHNEDETELDFNTDWELVAEAGRAAFDGYEVVDGKVEWVLKGLRKRSGAANIPE